MRSKTLLAAASAAAVLALTLAGCSAATTTSPTSESSPAAVEAEAMVYTGTFAGLNDKAVAGTVTISGSTVTLSGFSSDEGPDLHLYLTNGSEEGDISEGTLLGTVAFDQETQTFTLPAGVDVADFTTVVVHCDKALASFGAAAIAS